MAVKQNGLALQYVSENNRNDKMIIDAALEQNPLAFEHLQNDNYEYEINFVCEVLQKDFRNAQFVEYDLLQLEIVKNLILSDLEDEERLKLAER